MIKNFHESKNLFDGTIVQGGVYDSGDLNYFTNRVRVLLTVTAGKTYTITSNKGVKNIYAYSGDWADTNNKVGLIWTGNTYPPVTQFTVPTGATKVGISLANADSSNIIPSDVVEPMLLEGEYTASTLPPYEPYGDTWNTKSYAKSISGAQTYTKFPIVFRTTEQSIPTWTIKGNEEYTGTPTPSNPVDVNGVGVRTENLWNASVEQGAINSTTGAETSNNERIRSTSIALSQGTYTISASGSAQDVFIYLYGTDDTYIGIYDSSWARMPTSITLSANCKVRFVFKKYSGTVVPSDISDIMLNTGSTAKPFEPYGYKIPISSGGVTTNIYLGSTQTVRQVKKIVFDGTEDWQGSDISPTKNLTLDGYAKISGISCVSTHYNPANNVVSGDPIPYDSCCFYLGASNVVYLKGNESDTYPKTITDFKAYLAQQYAAGTPVTVWYVLATPQTAAVNEPLMKIGTYADTLSNAAQIATTSGLNTIDVATSLKPSEMSLTYDGYKLCKRQRYSRTENLFDVTAKDTSHGYVADCYLNSDGTFATDRYNYQISEYISIESEEYYTLNYGSSLNLPSVCFYDSNYNYISGIQYSRIIPLTFQTPPNTAFCRFSMEKVLENVVMLNTGSTAKPYQPYLDWE